MSYIPGISRLVDFARKHNLAYATYSDRTAINSLRKPTPIVYCNPCKIPNYIEDECHEDLCMLFLLKQLNIAYGFLRGSVKYAYPMGGNSSTVKNYTERLKNTHARFPEYISETGVFYV